MNNQICTMNFKEMKTMNTFENWTKKDTDIFNTYSVIGTAPSQTAMVSVNTIKRDMSYQRDLKKAKIKALLSKYDGFDNNNCGAISLSRRSSGELYVWDGAHRLEMAKVSGITEIPATINENGCSIQEAGWFNARNTHNAKTTKPEDFKASVHNQDPEALKMLGYLKAAGLNVGGTNPSGVEFKGITQFKKACDTKANPGDPKYAIKAGQLVSSLWNEKNTNIDSRLIEAIAIFVSSYCSKRNFDVSYLEKALAKAHFLGTKQKDLIAKQTGNEYAGVPTAIRLATLFNDQVGRTYPNDNQTQRRLKVMPKVIKQLYNV